MFPQRYGPSDFRDRYGYDVSPELLERLTPRRRAMLQVCLCHSVFLCLSASGCLSASMSLCVSLSVSASVSLCVVLSDIKSAPLLQPKQPLLPPHVMEEREQRAKSIAAPASKL